MVVWDADGALERDAQIVVDNDRVAIQLAAQRFLVRGRHDARVHVGWLSKCLRGVDCGQVKLRVAASRESLFGSGRREGSTTLN